MNSISLMVDLNDLIDNNPGWVLEEAYDINDKGKIVGLGWIEGNYHAYLLSPIKRVAIDIRPESKVNRINPRSRGRVSVAILSAVNFDAPSQVDRNSLTFGHNGDEHSLAFCNSRPIDVNRDGYADLICHFFQQKARFLCGDSEGILRGQTLDGWPIKGTDSVNIGPCK